MIHMRITTTPAAANMLQPHHPRPVIHMLPSKGFILKQANSRHLLVLFLNNTLYNPDLVWQHLYRVLLHTLNKATHLLHLHRVPRRRPLKRTMRMLPVRTLTHHVVLKM